MKIRRNAGGYTLLELLAAVAIVTILTAVSAVNVVRHQRTLAQTEFDGIAREIFVAAQNHLTMVESQGFMGISEEANFGLSDTSGVYYYVVNGNIPKTPPNMLNLMLPVGSVDAAVRLGGSYVIRYQKEPALVLDVFYAARNGRFTHTFSPKSDENPEGEVDENWILEYRDNKDEDKKEARRYYGAENTVIGWYGSTAEPIPKGAPLEASTIEVVNAELLYVKVTNPASNALVANAGLKLIIRGEQSGNTEEIDLIDKDGNIKVGSDKSQFPNVYLDDVTSDDKHFYNVCKNLYPGENITVWAEAYNDKELTNVATSASVQTNSLFASLEKRPDPHKIVTPATVKIANFRHLANLDNKVSSIDDTISHVENPPTSTENYYLIPPPDDHSKQALQIERAEQTGDMDWTKFVDNVKAEKKTDKAQMYNKDGASLDGHYLPIANQRKIEYSGTLKDNDGNRIRAAKISNVKVKVNIADGDAGLFATFGNQSTVSDLELWNFDVKSNGGAAGAFAGVLDGSTVNGVLATHENDKTSDVEGQTSVGGLIGKAQGKFEVKQSAAAVYVLSTGEDAGGLIGAVADDASGAVKDSYAGGHTKNGNYQDECADKNRCNVKGATNAGGLIGSVTGAGALTVENCYATTSVGSKTAAGGLIGAAARGDVKNCYAAGYVVVSDKAAFDKAGAFAGRADASVKFEEDGYFSFGTGELPAVGDNADADGIDALDDEIDAYGAGKAKPYDAFLQTNYKGLYSFKTIGELNDEITSPEWMTTHYGDWAAPDTLVVNTPVSS